MNEMKEEANASGPLPWRSPDYKPTPEAIKSFQEDIGPVTPPEDDEDIGQQPML